MTFRGLALGLVVMLATGCGPSGAKSEQAAGAVTAAGAAAATPAAGAPPEDLLAFANGTLIVVEPADSDDAQLAWSPYNMIDEAPISEWRGAFKGPPVFVFELAQKSEISGIGIDNGSSMEQSAARQVRIEVSDQSESAGFQTLLTASLALADGQSFKADKPLTGRWIRLTVLTNGGGEYASVTGLRASGR
ncbi:MAG: discoidin domain-containing protein, partial [Caulobacteraceae bacterium]